MDILVSEVANSWQLLDKEEAREKDKKTEQNKISRAIGSFHRLFVKN